ncbi:hypothetical protein AMJ49_00515, partial [Parcubacteria bacterium DG_74_2]
MIFSYKNKEKRVFISLVTILIILLELVGSVLLFPIEGAKAEPNFANLEELKIKEIEPEKYAFKSLSEDVIEIGTEKHSPPQPYLKLEKWDEEVSLKINIPFAVEDKIVLDENKVRYQGKVDIEFYPREPEEIEEEIAGELHSFKQNKQGGVEFDTILYQKPESNIFEFSIETKGLKFYYQPPLDPDHPTWADENGNGIADSFRPENVVGSYAVYHEIQDKFFKTEEEAEKYKVGKVFHIYRPKVEDVEGNEIWADLNIDKAKGTLIITIDQSWLDNASYPVKVDPNFGYETEGGTSYNLHAISAGFWKRAGTAWEMPAAGIAGSLSAYIGGGNSFADFTAGINQKDSEGTDSHGEIEYKENLDCDAADHWETFILAGTSFLSIGVDYILNIEATGGTSFQAYYVYGDANEVTSYIEQYGDFTWESPWDVSPEGTAVKYSIYCTYNEQDITVQAFVSAWLSFTVSPTTTPLSPDLVDTGGGLHYGSSTDITLSVGTNAAQGWNITIEGKYGGLCHSSATGTACATTTDNLIASVDTGGTTALDVTPPGSDGYGANATPTASGVTVGTYYDNWGTQTVGAIASSTSQTLASKGNANASQSV